MSRRPQLRMFARWPALFIQAFITSAGLRWPAAMFSAMADQRYPAAVMRCAAVTPEGVVCSKYPLAAMSAECARAAFTSRLSLCIAAHPAVARCWFTRVSTSASYPAVPLVVVPPVLRLGAAGEGFGRDGDGEAAADGAALVAAEADGAGRDADADGPVPGSAAPALRESGPAGGRSASRNSATEKASSPAMATPMATGAHRE
jgi:hypothetical protein